MSTHFLKKIFVFFVGVFLALSFAVSVSAQSDGTAPSAGTIATDTSPIVSSPRAMPASATAATSAPAAIIPRGETPPPVPKPVGAPLLPSKVSQMPATAPSAPPAPVPATPFPYALIALAVAIVLAPYGMARMLAQNKVDKKEDTGNRCDQIKQLLERKKSTLEIVSGTISLKQILIGNLVKKIEEKKEELKDKITTVVIDEVAGEEGGKIIHSAKEVNETYETLVENLEQAKKALEYFINRQKNLSADVGKIESAYQTCMLGGSIFSGASRLGSELELFETGLRQKLYRYTSREKDVFSHELVLSSNLAELAEAGKWLPTPELPAGTHRFFLTEKGKEEYEKVLLPLHKKYLPDISCEETDLSAINTVVYEDEWQVVTKKDS